MTNHPTPDSTARDRSYPALSAADADELRELVRKAFAEAGHEVYVQGDSVRDADGTTYALRPAVMDAYAAEASQRSAVVARHVRAMLRERTAEPFTQSGRSDALTRVYPHLMAAESAAPLAIPTRTVCAGLVSGLVLDEADTLHVLSSADVQQLGEMPDVVRAAEANLMQLPLPAAQEVAQGEVSYRVIADDSPHVASLVLTPKQLLAQGVSTAPHGVIVVVPNRHVVAWHVVRDASVLPSINALADFAWHHFATAPYPVQPGLLWWDGTTDGHLDLVVERGADGAATMRPSPGFADALNSVCPK